LSERPAQIRAEVVNTQSYPRRRGDRHLAELRRDVFAHLGLDGTW
jgi:NitT/TauT family transport system ATP-binding protein